MSTEEGLEIAVKTLAGGCLVVLFALVAQVVRPKTFAGVFAAAPAVALAGLTVSGVASGPHDVRLSASGMVAGGCGIVAYCAAVLWLHPRLDALRASFTALAAWFAVASLVYFALL